LEFIFPRQKKEMNKKRSPIEEVAEKELGNDGLETDTNDGRGE
jgi:hypothetical protein